MRDHVKHSIDTPSTLETVTDKHFRDRAVQHYTVSMRSPPFSKDPRRQSPAARSYLI